VLAPVRVCKPIPKLQDEGISGNEKPPQDLIGDRNGMFGNPDRAAGGSFAVTATPMFSNDVSSL